MAEDFVDWLKTAVEKHLNGADKPVLVVGLTGKNDVHTEKFAILDQLLGCTTFCGRYGSESLIKIDAYYSSFHQIVFLYLNSYQDADVQEKLFDSEKTFFEALNEVEHLYIEYLFILCTLSHLLIFLHPDTRGDTTILRHLISVNEMRIQKRPQLMEKLESVDGLPIIWKDEGRLALPRLLFIYRDNRSRSSYARVSQEELNNSIDRLERTREFQLVHMMKRCSIAAEHLGLALCSLTPHRIPFVHVLLPGESEINTVTDTLQYMFRGEIASNDIRAKLELQSNSVLSSENQLDSTKFILGHVKDIVKNDHELPYFFLLPKFKDFISGAQVVLQATTSNEVYSQELIKSWLSEELHFVDDVISQVSFYAYELYNYLTMDEKIGPMFFDPHLSEFRHYRAIQYVGAFLKVTLNENQLDLAWPKVLKQCNVRFKARRNQCDVQSISGVRCSLLIHKLPAEYIPDQTMDETLKDRSFPHCSGYSYLSACSCGRTQKRRLDPFTAKEGNYDFYSSFGCCAKAEVMPFKLYNPGIKWDVSQTKSVVVKRRNRVRRENRDKRGIQLLSRNNQDNVPEEQERCGTYTIVKPKSQTSIVNELLWQYNKMMIEHKDKYLSHMPHSAVSIHLPPLYPSWSVICVGHSKLYVHSKGLNDQPGFVRNSEFLMPYDINLNVKSEAWSKGMKEILQVNQLSYKERKNDQNVIDKTHKEKLKFFIGFEYECPSGHRFMISKPNKILMHDKMNGNVNTDASELISSSLSLFMPCKCSNDDILIQAQLQRFHCVTPKAPIVAKLNPLIEIDESGYFHMGTVAELNWGRYYILRFPFVYEGPDGIVPKTQINGTLLANCMQIHQKM